MNQEQKTAEEKYPIWPNKFKDKDEWLPEEIAKRERAAFIDGTEYAQQREQPWVRVSDRLPENCTPVICYWGPYGSPDKEDMTIEDLVDDKRDTLTRTWPVTHWMPLPAPPK